SHSHATPPTGNRHEHVGQFIAERCLFLGRQYKVSITLRLRSERCKYPAMHTKVRRAHMGALFRTLETQRDALEIRRSHSLRSQCHRYLSGILSRLQSSPSDSLESRSLKVASHGCSGSMTRRLLRSH